MDFGISRVSARSFSNSFDRLNQTQAAQTKKIAADTTSKMQATNAAVMARARAQSAQEAAETSQMFQAGLKAAAASAASISDSVTTSADAASERIKTARLAAEDSSTASSYNSKGKAVISSYEENAGAAPIANRNILNVFA